jgi:Domain of unknown function (DUF4337)
MEVAEVAEKIRESVEEERTSDEHFRRRAAVAVGILAMLLAITHLGGAAATKETINYNILASDTWAFFQAKNIRQTNNQLAADQLELRLLSEPGLSAEARAALQQRVDRYRTTAARYESEPDPKDPTNPLKGEGKKELTARARNWEKMRDHAQQQIPNFEFSEALFQIGIVLGSVSIVAAARWLLGLGLALGVVALGLMLNGFFLFFNLPIGQVPH